MTDLLRDTLRERAERDPAPRFDAGAIIRAGDRRVRRSRVTAGLAAASVVGLVAAGATVVPELLESERSLTATPSPPYVDRRLSFATEDVIYWGRDATSAGVTVTSYVPTDEGFVLATRNGSVWLHNGVDSRRLGHSVDRSLRADDTGSLVAWLSFEPGSRRQEVVVMDTATGEEVGRLPAGVRADGNGDVLAVDDGQVYWSTADGITRYDVRSAETELVWRAPAVVDPADRPERVEVVDVAGGTIAYVAEGERGSRMMVGPEIGGAARAMPSGWHGVLSPDGAYLGVEEADELGVYDTATGEDVTPDLPGYPFKVVYGWVDADTATVFALESLEEEPFVADFLTCEIPAGDCQVVWNGVEVHQYGLTLPVGDPMDS